jgi:hypothetical protein
MQYRALRNKGQPISGAQYKHSKKRKIDAEMYEENKTCLSATDTSPSDVHSAVPRTFFH